MFELLFLYFVPMIVSILLVQLNDYLGFARKDPFAFYVSLIPLVNWLMFFISVGYFICCSIIFLGEKFFVSKN